MYYTRRLLEFNALPALCPGGETLPIYGHSHIALGVCMCCAVTWECTSHTHTFSRSASLYWVSLQLSLHQD